MIFISALVLARVFLDNKMILYVSLSQPSILFTEIHQTDLVDRTPACLKYSQRAIVSLVSSPQGIMKFIVDSSLLKIKESKASFIK